MEEVKADESVHRKRSKGLETIIGIDTRCVTPIMIGQH